MSELLLTLPVVGEKDSGAEPKVGTALKAIEEFINGAKLESTNNIKVEGITEASLSSALKTKLGGSFVGLEVKSEAASFEAESTKLYNCTKALTCTLPAATAGRTVGVLGNASAELIKVSAKAGKKIKVGFEEPEIITLTFGMAAVFEADGTNWWKIGGEVKNENAYGALTVREGGTLFEASATRPTQVFLQGERTGVEGVLRIAPIVGGVALPEVNLQGVHTGNLLSTTFIVPPGVKWEVLAASNVNFKSSYLTL